MSEINAAVEVFTKALDVFRTIRRLCDAGFDPLKLSVVTRYSAAGTNASGVAQLDDILVSEIQSGTPWDSTKLLRPGWACFQIPKLGVVLAAGPLAGWIEAALGNEALFSGLSSVGAGLCSIGIPRSLVPFYEAELKAGRFLLVAHGSARDVEWARSVIDNLTEKGRYDSTSSTSRRNDRT